MNKYMYDNFEEAVGILGIEEGHPNWLAFKTIWNLARTPSITVGKDGKLKYNDGRKKPKAKSK